MKCQTVDKKSVHQMLQEAIEQVEEAGIRLAYPIIPKVRFYKATSYFGKLVYKRDRGEFEVTISEYHLRNGYDAVMGTLIHEVLHACEGSRGHGKQWQEYASIVNEYYGYKVSRMGTYENGSRLPRNEYKVNYVLECVGCGETWERMRKSKLVTEYENYSCGKCGGKLDRIL